MPSTRGTFIVNEKFSKVFSFAQIDIKLSEKPYGKFSKVSSIFVVQEIPDS